MCMTNAAEEKRQTKQELERELNCQRGCSRGTVIMIELPNDRAMLECSMCQWATSVVPRKDVKTIWQKLHLGKENERAQRPRQAYTI